MMAAILNSTMLDPDTAILDSDTIVLSSLRLTHTAKIGLPPLWLLTQTNSNLTQTYLFSLNLMMAAIFNSTMLD